MLAGNLEPGLGKAKLPRAEFSWCGGFSLRRNKSRDRAARPWNEAEGMIDHLHLGRFRETTERMRLWHVLTVFCDLGKGR